MKQHLASVSVLVRDYDEAIAYYTGVLGFDLREDTAQPDGKRWVVVAPPGSTETCLILARAVKPEQVNAIGIQGGGRVWLFLHTDDFWRDHRAYSTRGVKFCENPRTEPY